MLIAMRAAAYSDMHMRMTPFANANRHGRAGEAGVLVCGVEEGACGGARLMLRARSCVFVVLRPRLVLWGANARLYMFVMRECMCVYLCAHTAVQRPAPHMVARMRVRIFDARVLFLCL